MAVDTVFSHVLQMIKLKHREIELTAQGHTK